MKRETWNFITPQLWKDKFIFRESGLTPPPLLTLYNDIFIFCKS